jgi:hypothetical protein
VPRRSSIDGEFALVVGGLLVLDAFVIAWFGFGPYRTASELIGYGAGSFAGLIALLVAAGASLLGVRRRRFGRAPTHLTRNDVLSLVFAGVLGGNAVVILALRGVRADLETLAIGGLGAGGLGLVLWVGYRLVTTAQPLRAHPDIGHRRKWFDWNHELPPHE